MNESKTKSRSEYNEGLVIDYLGWAERGDLKETLDRTWADKIAYHGRELGELKSRDELFAMLSRFGGAMTDIKIDIETMLSDDQYVLGIMNTTGTMSGDDGSGTVKASGETMTFRSIDMWRVKDGKLVEQWIIEGVVDHNNPDRARVD